MYRCTVVSVIVCCQYIVVPCCDLSAVYAAVGLASFDMYDLVDFDHWFMGSLVAELQNGHPKYDIIFFIT